MDKVLLRVYRSYALGHGPWVDLMFFPGDSSQLFFLQLAIYGKCFDNIALLTNIQLCSAISIIHGRRMLEMGSFLPHLGMIWTM